MVAGAAGAAGTVSKASAGGTMGASQRVEAARSAPAEGSGLSSRSTGVPGATRGEGRGAGARVTTEALRRHEARILGRSRSQRDRADAPADDSVDGPADGPADAPTDARSHEEKAEPSPSSWSDGGEGRVPVSPQEDFSPAWGRPMGSLPDEDEEEDDDDGSQVDDWDFGFDLSSLRCGERRGDGRLEGSESESDS